jgi:predicted DNA-binding protein YlxM (UPF0122 family)
LLEKVHRINLLCDFYGQLLTKRQREILELYYKHDLSFGEIAEEYNISRQGAYDLVNRAVNCLERLEKKLKLFRRFQYQQKKLQEALSILENEKINPEEHETLKKIIVQLLTDQEFDDNEGV